MSLKSVSSFLAKNVSSHFSLVAIIVVMLAVPVAIWTEQQTTHTTQFAAQQHIQASVCSTICSPTTSCGAPVNVKGSILDQNNKGVAGVPVTIYTHNRGDISSPGATMKVTTDASGNYVVPGFLCNGMSVTTGDNYAVRPDWSHCGSGTCANPLPISYESNQIRKPRGNDCAATACNFNVTYTASNSAVVIASNSAGVVASTSAAVTLQSIDPNQTCQADTSTTNQAICHLRLTASNTTGQVNWTGPQGNYGIMGINNIAVNNQPTSSDTGTIPAQAANSTTSSNDITVSIACNAGKVVYTLAITDSQDNLATSRTAVLSCGSQVQITFAFLGMHRPPVHTNRQVTLLLVPSSTPTSRPIRMDGNGVYDAASGQFKAVIPLTQVPAGNYTISLHIDGALDSQLAQPGGNTTFTLPGFLTAQPVTLVPGDIGPAPHGDNFIDIIDYNKLIGCLHKAPLGSCQSSDLNDDGRIDESDLSLLLGQFGELGFSLATPQFSCTLDPACQSGQGTLQMCALICTQQTGGW